MKRTVWFLGALTLVLICTCTLADAQDQPVTTTTTNIVTSGPAPSLAPSTIVHTAPAGATSATPQPNGSVIYTYPLIHDLYPYLVAALGLLIGALATATTTLVGIWCLWIKAKWNISIDQATQAKIDAAIKSFADYADRQSNIWIAAQEPGWRDKVITVNDPWIAAAANAGIARLPDAMVLAGMSPEKLTDWITAKIGQAQKQAGSSLPPPPAVAL